VSTPSPSAKAGSSPVVKALQGALDAEHAAVYGYGVAGGRLAGAAQTQARAAMDAHRARRDALARLITDQGGVPQAAGPAYTIPFPVDSAEAATRLAVFLEDGVALHLGELVAVAAGPVRDEAAGWLRESAVWGVRWRGASTPFPGLPGPGLPAEAVAKSGTGNPTAGGRK
jgi:uncharacterized protein DUF4439